ncbi:MAG: hypothetical protein IJU94_06100, partial [Clostridia bacterium]|nr:hypothetical protein [Clostridia bacterium]
MEQIGEADLNEYLSLSQTLLAVAFAGFCPFVVHPICASGAKSPSRLSTAALPRPPLFRHR